jgi:hypothetical protein
MARRNTGGRRARAERRAHHVADAGLCEAAGRRDGCLGGLWRCGLLLRHGHSGAGRRGGVRACGRGLACLAACHRVLGACRHGAVARRASLCRAALQPLHRVPAACAHPRPGLWRTEEVGTRQARGTRPRQPCLHGHERRGAARGLLCAHHLAHLHRRAHGDRGRCVPVAARAGVCTCGTCGMGTRGRSGAAGRLARLGRRRPQAARPCGVALRLRAGRPPRPGRGAAVWCRRVSPRRP